MQAEDGEELKLTVLKCPISLETLEYENVNKLENTDVNSHNVIDTFDKVFEKDISAVTKHKTVTDKSEKLKRIKKNLTQTNKPNIKYTKGQICMLKEPISLDNIEWVTEDSNGQSTATYTVKTVLGFLPQSLRTEIKSAENEAWKQNALTIFEYSFVYPFIHANNKYKCFTCSKTFLDASILAKHSLNEHSVKEMKRELDNRMRDKHIKVDVTNLQCRICLELSTDLKNLKIHLQNHGKDIKPSLQDNIIPFKLRGDNFECQICGERYLKLRLLVIHMNKHFNNFNCEICGAMFVTLNLLKRHLQIHETGSFPCDKCDKVFSNRSKRTLHIRGVHLKKIPRRCPICPERFNSNYQRTKHLRVVHNQTTGLFRCDTCGREYDLKYTLFVHIRSVHLQERNHECHVCHARFFSKNTLSRHMITHTGEKNFKCDICGRLFARNKNLREHTRSHEVGVCSICGQNYGDQNTLLAHISSVHGMLPS